MNPREELDRARRAFKQNPTPALSTSIQQIERSIVKTNPAWPVRMMLGTNLDHAVGMALRWTRMTVGHIVDGKVIKTQAPLGFWDEDDSDAPDFAPSARWSQGGPLIDEYGISIIRVDDEYGTDRKGFSTLEHIPVWAATTGVHGTQSSYEGQHYPDQYEVPEVNVHYGHTPLVAAMRRLVFTRLGPEVQIPKA